MKGRFFESDFVEAKNNFEWIRNLVTTLQHEVPYDGHWPGPGPAPVLDGPIEEARLRVAVALGLGPIEVLPRSDEGLLPVDRLALRIRERLTGESAQENVESLERIAAGFQSTAFYRAPRMGEPETDANATVASGTSNSGVEESQVVDNEGGDEAIKSATETATL